MFGFCCALLVDKIQFMYSVQIHIQCPQCKDIFTIKNMENPNFLKINIICTLIFHLLNATKFVFCCVNICGNARSQLFCAPYKDTRMFGNDRRGCGRSVRRASRWRPEKQGGGGYGQAVSAGVSPINTRQNKKSLLKNSAKRKKAFSAP